MKFIIIKKIFLNNIGLKCISIVLGILLWLYVSNEEETIKKFKIPISYEGISRNLYLSYCSKDNILLTVQGKREDILSYQSSDFSFSLNLSQRKAGTYIYKILSHKIIRPQNIAIIKVHPKYIKVILKAKSIKGKRREQ